MASREQLRALSQVRLAEAIDLLAAEHWSGAYYLAGYAAECGLKAIIARRFTADTIPNRALVNSVYTHDLGELVRLAGLEPALKKARTEPAFNSNWLTVSGWSETSRYAIIDRATATALVEALRLRPDGVHLWLMRHW